jgi:7,8-dihydropterin-6-yl-methyl-4-(beta-D-ribofuranosyl)aminobenzene 5'-phosphate synthase
MVKWCRRIGAARSSNTAGIETLRCPRNDAKCRNWGRASAEHGFHVIAKVDKLDANDDRASSKYGMERQMASMMRRREFLAGSAALAGAAMGGGFTCVEVASAAPIEVPVIDKLSIRVLVDSMHNLFLRSATVNGVSVQPTPIASGFPNVIHTQWGLSLWLESQRVSEPRTLMLDYGYTPDVLINNMGIMGIDVKKVDALIVSHGHFDHYGGLTGFLDKYRSVLPVELKLYAGGEDNFCHRLIGGAPGQLTDFGTLDRRALAAQRVSVVLCEHPTVIAGHAFTTGQIKRSGIEKILPNTMVEYGIKDGLGCDATQYTHFSAAELQGKVVPDEHIHEHATCFNVKDRGLVVITSCGHVGILNTIRQAQEVSGISKLHALIGGFHLGPATPDYTNQVVAELKTFAPDVVVPMHCSGQTFVDSVQKIMPDKLLLASAAARLDFGA